MKAIQKDFWREIKNTRSRFLSILILVALAVAFLSGLRSTAPDMKATCDSYMDQQNFMDIQILSTLGLTEEDVEILRQQPGVSAAEGAWVIDAFASGPDLDIVAKVWSLPKQINQVTLQEGRLPEAADECAVEEELLNTLGLSLGDTLELKTQGAYDDALSVHSFTIVGQLISPYYISVERGTSTLGSGRVAAYVYLPAAAFDTDVYTAAYLLVDGARELTAFYSDYTSLVDGVIDDLEPLGEEHAALRRESLVDEATEKLNEAQQKLDDAKAEAARELGDAWAELLDGRRELEDGWRELADAKETLAQETADAQQELEEAKLELVDAEIQLDDGEQEYAQGVMDYEEGWAELEDGWREYADGLAEYEDGKKELEEARQELASASAALAAAQQQLSTSEIQLNQLLDQLAEPVSAVLAQQGMPLPITSGTELLAAMTDAVYGQAVTDAVSAVLSALYAAGELTADELLALSEADPVTAGMVAALILPSVNEALTAMGQAPLTSVQALFTQLAMENVQPPDPGGEGGETGGETGGESGEEPGEEPGGSGGDPGEEAGGDSGEEPGGSGGEAGGEIGGDSGEEAGGEPDEEMRSAALLFSEAGNAPVHAAVNAALGGLQSMRSALESQTAPGTAMTGQEILAARQQIQSGWAEYYGGRLDYNEGKAEYENGKKELEEAKAQLDDAKVELSKARYQLLSARFQLEDARAELDDGWEEYRSGLREVADGERELAEQIASAQEEIADATHDLREGEVEYNDGLREYYDGQREAEEKIADGEKELADARRKVADIDTCEWYILDRDSNPGYQGFGQDADRMGNLASVFPLLFFLVAALVCLTTMTRMVEDQRIQIGCMKALGYRRLTISRKYLGYGALPALLGGVLGLAIGYTLFPKMIFTAYQIMYDVPDIQLAQYSDITAFSLLAALACTTLSTLWACFSVLAAVPAELMRPRAPKPGKRVLLEYIRPLWRRMGFNLKVTARNLFRYQKRFWMTVIGIGGCTALIIAAFGLRSSLLVTMDRQYNDLYHYTAQVALSSNVLETERESIRSYIEESADITASLPCRLSSVTAETGVYSLTAYLEVAEGTSLGDFVELRDYRDKTPLTLDGSGAIITQKLAELLQVDVGDSFTVDSDGRFPITVADITEHYLAHFIYMSPEYYAQVFGEAYESNAYLLTLSSDSQELCDQVFSRLMELNGVASATRMQDTRDTYLTSMERIDFVVVIVILSAAALAMVVLYNLSNINITERQRELATIKVLGFYDREVSAYVYRENIVLTAFGIALGIALGHFLHAWLVKSVEIELMMFGRDTDPMAYVWAAGLTVLFSVLVNLMAHRRMKKIDMVESLKSAE